MTSLIETFFVTGAVTVAAMLLLWLASTFRRDVSIVDLYWGVGFAIVAAVAAIWNAPPNRRGWVIAGLTTVWGLRLSVHLLRRNWGRAEDRRYASIRLQHGPRFVWISLFTVFLLQAILLWFISLPQQVAMVSRAADFPTMLDVLGVALWCVGFFFEAVGDWQLARFQADPQNRGRVLDRGLWRYTRHPNYFGDACIWWGLYLLSAAGGGTWTIASPLLMTFLLLRISGVSLLEQTIVERRPEYAEYQARTNAFIPGPPKRRATKPHG